MRANRSGSAVRLRLLRNVSVGSGPCHLRAGTGCRRNLGRCSASFGVGSAGSPLSGVKVLGWGFDAPWAVATSGAASVGGGPWQDGHGAFGLDRRPCEGHPRPGYGFNGSLGIASDGTHIWVANPGGQSVTELSASTGALVKVIRGQGYGFDDPWAITTAGGNIWVTNNRSVTELSAATGALVRVIRGQGYGFDEP